MPFIKKHFWNIIFGLFLIILVFNPFGLGMTIKTTINKVFSFSPSIIKEEKREQLSTYNWNLVSQSDEKMDFNTMQGEVILVNFWATWCPPCIAEMPSLEALYKDYGTKIKFVLVANDEARKVDKFMLEKGYTMPVYYEESSTPAQLSSSSIPATYLIDKQGNLVIAKTGSADWNSDKTRKIIDELLVK